jgi:hypothetical protein
MDVDSECVNPRFDRKRSTLAAFISDITKIEISNLAKTVKFARYTAMSELTNLTDRISHLRDRKGGSPVMQNGGHEPEKPSPKKVKPVKRAVRRSPERRFANDYFMVFVYALLAIAMLTQFVLIAWLDLI